MPAEVSVIAPETATNTLDTMRKEIGFARRRRARTGILLANPASSDGA
jgi:hypothetical protein